METKFFIGLDVHKENTAFAVRDTKGNVILDGETASIYKDLIFHLGPYLHHAEIGLETSRSFYTLYQDFLKNGYKIKVANTIQLRQLIAKNDRLDARRLSEMLRLGSFPCSFIPCQEIQRLRSFVNLRHSLMEEKTRCKIRIQTFIDFNGIAMPAQKSFSERWKRALVHQIESREDIGIKHAYEHYLFLEEKVKRVDKEMVEYTKGHWQECYELLKTITGIGPVVACYVIANVLPVERFASKRKLRRYAGVVPTFLESGKTKSRGKLPKNSSRKLLRWALIQAANATSKTDTKLGRYYRKKKKQKRNAGIAKVAVASSLTDIIYEVLKNRKPYVPN